MQGAFLAAPMELSRLTGPLRHALEIPKRARRLHDLPDLDAGLEHAVDTAARTRIRVEAGTSFEWPRSPAAKDRKHVVVVDGTGKFVFVGEWSDIEQREWIR